MLGGVRGFVVLLLLVLALAGCGGGSGEAHEWAGLERPYPENGVLPVDEFREHAESVDEDWEREPEALAREYLGVEDGTVTMAGPRLTLLRDSLEDDSVRAERYVLELEQDDDVWELVSARWEQRCHLMRGHQEFTPELCL
jgi:Tfp pilus assembly protein PilP